MIDVNGLRLGNYVYKTDDRTQQKVAKQVFMIQPSYVSLDKQNGNPCDIHLVEPIPLCHDLLYKNSFNLIDDRFYSRNVIDKIGVGIKLNGDGSLFIVMNSALNGYIEIPVEAKIKYLHQLQNLYFDLTGKELEVNL